MKYIFNTKFISDKERNGQECEIIEIRYKATDNQYDLINVKFADGYVTECYRFELIER